MRRGRDFVPTARLRFPHHRDRLRRAGVVRFLLLGPTPAGGTGRRVRVGTRDGQQSRHGRGQRSRDDAIIRHAACYRSGDCSTPPARIRICTCIASHASFSPPPRAVDRLVSSPAWGGAYYALLHARVFDNLLWRRRATGSLERRWRPLPSVAASAAFAMVARQLGSRGRRRAARPSLCARAMRAAPLFGLLRGRTELATQLAYRD